MVKKTLVDIGKHWHTIGTMVPMVTNGETSDGIDMPLVPGWQNSELTHCITVNMLNLAQKLNIDTTKEQKAVKILECLFEGINEIEKTKCAPV